MPPKPTAASLIAGYRAVRIGGVRLMFNGWDWFAMPDRVPAEARPHMRAALRCWACAAGCLVLAAVAAALRELDERAAFVKIIGSYPVAAI